VLAGRNKRISWMDIANEGDIFTGWLDVGHVYAECMFMQNVIIILDEEGREIRDGMMEVKSDAVRRENKPMTLSLCSYCSAVFCSGMMWN
jgi:hypothetical protein